MSFNFSKTLTPRDRLIFPLDLHTRKEARQFIALLAEVVGFFKVGLELYSAEGPRIIKLIQRDAPNSGIFLDLKLHDIPATVARTMDIIKGLGVDMVTVHALGGVEMLQAATEKSGSTKVLAVTLLTSLSPQSLPELKTSYRARGALTELLAKRALSAGCHGLVASSQEVSLLREISGPNSLLVIPGIRPSWATLPGDDQKRVGTPLQAIQDGADFLVVGRPIRDAVDPFKAAQKIVAEIAS
ncbi:MAG: orotidine-5'-phosphate decarboxylase [Deltaproteobacteria bacterium]|nr:orotidine-5'-phosphate decarboxylase [Deltaproteobacteria bacterium]